jgi:hypothetical protein
MVLAERAKYQIHLPCSNAKAAGCRERDAPRQRAKDGPPYLTSVDWHIALTCSSLVLPHSSSNSFPALNHRPSSPLHQLAPSGTVVVQARLSDPVSGQVLARYSDWPQTFKLLDLRGECGLKIECIGEEIKVEAEKPIKGVWFSASDGVTQVGILTARTEQDGPGDHREEKPAKKQGREASEKAGKSTKRWPPPPNQNGTQASLSRVPRQGTHSKVLCIYLCFYCVPDLAPGIRCVRSKHSIISGLRSAIVLAPSSRIPVTISFSSTVR